MSGKQLNKGRSMKTYNNKINKLRSYYRKLFKNSQANEELDIKKGYTLKKKYFCNIYITEKDFLAKFKIKPANSVKGI